MSQAWTEPCIQGSALFWLSELSMGKSTSWALLITVKISAFRASAWILVPVIECSVAEMRLAGKLIDSRNNSYISLGCFVSRANFTQKHSKGLRKSIWSHSEGTCTHFFHTGLTRRENEADGVKASRRLSEFPPESSTAQRKPRWQSCVQAQTDGGSTAQGLDQDQTLALTQSFVPTPLTSV